MKKISLCGFILVILLIFPFTALATTINGYTFDEDSFKLTNKWFLMSVGRIFYMKCVTSGAIFCVTPVGPETVYGVNCLRYTGGSHEWWLAQDMVGNIHVFKHNAYEVNSDDDIPNLFLPADPAAIGAWSWQIDGFGPVYYEVLDNSAIVSNESIATYSNCLKISEGMTGDRWQIMYLKDSIGFVAHEETQDLCIRQCFSPDTDSDGVPDEWDQCPATPPDSVVDKSGCPRVIGDIDGDGKVGLTESIHSLQITAGTKSQ